MKIADFLTPEHTRANVSGMSKKRVLEYLSTLLHDDRAFTAVDDDTIYHKLLERERLGSTGIGFGVAIPHCRVAGCPEITGALLKLKEGIDFDAVDGDPVDLIFALVVPEEQNDSHLQALSSIAELLQDQETRERLRESSSNRQLFDLATSRDTQ